MTYVDLIGVRASIAGKRYSECIARLDNEVFRAEILCRRGFISKKLVRVYEIAIDPLKAGEYSRTGRIQHSDVEIIISDEGAKRLLEEARGYIYRRVSPCISRLLGGFREIFKIRSEALKRISELSTKPRDAIIKHVFQHGENGLAGERDVVENIVSILEGSLRKRAEELIQGAGGCPGSPPRLYETIYWVLSIAIEIQDMIYRGEPVERISKAIEEIGRALEGFSEEERKGLEETLGEKDLGKRSETLAEVISRSIEKALYSMIVREVVA